MKRTLRLAAAALAAVALATLGTAVPSAGADPNPGIIASGHAVSLKVYKYLGSPTGQPNNGTQQTVTGHDALSGVKFDAYKVYTDAARTTAVDLTTNAGWEAAANITGRTLTAAEIAAGSFTINSVTYYLGDVQNTPPTPNASVTTGTDGLADFTNALLDGIGLYLVNEDLAGSGTIQKCDTVPTCTTVDKTQVSPVYPFFVTLPMTNPDTLNTWMYDVYVYPKNQQDTGTKEVVDKNTQTDETTTAGDPDAVTFTISTPITDGMTATEMKMYWVMDQLDPRLTFQSVISVATTADNDPGTAGVQTGLSPGTDYTVTPVSPAAGALVKVELTSAGLVKIFEANKVDPAAMVVTTIRATITGTQGDGSIENTASFIPNQAFYDSHNGTGTNTDTVTSYYGELRITKQDPKDAAVKMPNAEFSVYIDPTPVAGAGTNVCSATDVEGTPVASGTTDANGLLTIAGLQTSNWYDGKTQTDLIHYCLVETKAPSGYNLNAQPISFTILKATEGVAFTPLTVNNEKRNLGNALPLTGGQGVAVLSIGGALLVGAGLTYYMAFSRRRHNAR